MADSAHDAVRWLPQARAGSAEALGRLLEACRGYLLLVATRELGDDLQAKSGASDLVQEAFLEAHRDFGRFTGDSEQELLAWLRRLLLNNLANLAREYRLTQKRRVGLEVPLRADSTSMPIGEGLVSPMPTPSGQAMANEQAMALERALERIPADYRRVIDLRFQREKSFEEIARELKRSLGAVRKLWARAIERLQQEMERSK